MVLLDVLLKLLLGKDPDALGRVGSVVLRPTKGSVSVMDTGIWSGQLGKSYLDGGKSPCAMIWFTTLIFSGGNTSGLGNLQLAIRFSASCSILSM